MADECVHDFQPLATPHLENVVAKGCVHCGVLLVPDDVATKTRKMIKGIVDLTTPDEGSDPNIAVTAVCMAAHFLLQATNYSHESFCKQLMGLKERDENGGPKA
jgi:hypothetical protein